MKAITLLFIFISLVYESKSQWVKVYHDSALVEVQDLHFFNKDTGLVCGQVFHGEGFVLRTTDGGATWNNTSSPVAICTYLFFLNDSVGYTGGQDGVIYKSEDGGITWNYCCNSGVPFDVDGFYCFNDSVWLTNRYGGMVMRTTNFGDNWMLGVYTITSNYGIPYFYERSINPFHFLNDSIGFVVGHGVFKTYDQGSTWLRMHADTSYYLRAITMKNPLQGFAVGNRGILLRTNDGGLNWSLDSISNQDLRAIEFINNMEGYCVGGGFGYFNDTTGIVLKTIDGGLSWTSTEVSKSRLNAIQFVDSVGYAVGNFGEIFKYIIPANSPTDTLPTLPDQVIIYPNPLNDHITISLPDISMEEIVVEIIDVNGKICLKQFIASQSRTFDINTFKLSNGIYNIRIIYGDTIITKKLVKSS